MRNFKMMQNYVQYNFASFRLFLRLCIFDVESKFEKHFGLRFLVFSLKKLFLPKNHRFPMGPPKIKGF